MESETFANVTSDILKDVATDTRVTISIVIILTCICFIILVNIIGNMGTIAAFIKIRSLRQKPGDLLILNLSIADLGVGLIQLYFLPALFQVWPWGKAGCQLNALLGNTFVVCGIYTTVCIAIDRYLMISREYPVYLKMQTKTRMYLYIVVIWGHGFLNGAIELILWDKVEVPGLGRDPFEYTQDCRSPPKHTFLYSLLLFVVNIFFPLALIEIFSTIFVIRLRKWLKGAMRS